MTTDTKKASSAWSPSAASAPVSKQQDSPVFQQPDSQSLPWQDPSATAPISPYIPTINPTTDRQKMAQSMASAGISNVAGKHAEYKSDRRDTGESMSAEGYSHVGDLGPKTTSETASPQGQAPETKAPVDSAKEIANAPPDRVKEVIDKIADEEKKGGPNFWDVIEAASAGWNGKTPLYVQKAIQQKAQENELQQIKKSSEEARKTASAEREQSFSQEQLLQKQQQAFQAGQTQKEIDLRRELAGLLPSGMLGTGKLSLQGFAPGLASSGVKK